MKTESSQTSTLQPDLRPALKLALLLSLLGGWVPGTWAAVQYTIIDLGTLGGAESGAAAINESGQVAGYAQTATAVHSFRWTPGGSNGPPSNPQMEDLHTLATSESGGNAINDSGQVVGEVYTHGNPRVFRAFLYSGSGPMQDLGTLGGRHGYAVGINDSGQVVGGADTTDEDTHAFLYSGSGPMQDLGTLGGTFSQADAINNSGQVAGSALTSEDAALRAFLYSGSGPMQDLGTLGGPSSEAYAINNRGQVVGQAHIDRNFYHAFRWTAGGSDGPPSNPQMKDLGTLGGTVSIAHDINDSGQVVGESFTSSGTWHAFLYSGSGPMQDLNDLIDPNSGWVLTRAVGINNKGQIVGTGTISGQTRAFLLTPTVVLMAMEVTQSVQDWFNGVALIADKDTYVRAFPEASRAADVGRAFEGKLRGFRNNTELAGSPLLPISSPTIALPEDAQTERRRFKGSLNFQLPPDWTRGTVRLELESAGAVLTDGEFVARGGPHNGAVSVTFQPVGRPKLALIPIGWSNISPPPEDEILKIVEWVRRMYPVSEFDLEWSEPTFDYTILPNPFSLFDTVLGVRLLNPRWFSEDRIALGFIRPELLEEGLFGDVAGMGGFLGADAAWFTANVGYEGFQTTAAHELAHVFGRPHPTPAGSIRGACGEIGFSEVFPWFFALDCAASPVSGRKPTLGPMDLGEPDKIYGFDPVGYVGLFGNNINESVLDPNCYFEMMSYCELGRSWISDYTYGKLLEALRSVYGSAASHTSPNAPLWAPLRAQGQTAHLLARGFIDLGTEAITWEPVQLLDPGPVPPSLPLGDFRLQALDGNGVLLAEVLFQPSRLPAADRTGSPNLAPFFATVPANPAIHRLSILHADVLLSSIHATAQAPSVQVLAPNGGEILSAPTFEIHWQASDADGDALTYRVDYSSDNGSTWHAFALNWPKTNLTVRSDDLRGSSQARLRVMASDGLNFASDESDASFTVPDKGPLLVLLQPADGAQFHADQPITFASLALDREEGPLSGANLQWSSDCSGILGTGQKLYLTARRLVPGDQQITLTARDSATHTTVKTIRIRIFQFYSPELRISSVSSNGVLVVEVVGTPQSLLNVEVSSDLRSWAPWQTLVQTKQSEFLLDTVPNGTGGRFYRARSEALPPP